MTPQPEPALTPPTGSFHSIRLYFRMLFRLGLVGFDYPEWAGTFYPHALPKKDRLTHYTTFFNTVEINTTFYAIPTRKTITNWADTAASVNSRAPNITSAQASSSAQSADLRAASSIPANSSKDNAAEPARAHLASTHLAPSPTSPPDLPFHPRARPSGPRTQHSGPFPSRLPFLVCPKLSREITHGPTPPGSLAASDSPPGHLTHPDTAAILRRWLTSIRGLSPHVGPILIQFPPRFAASRTQELHDFLTTLPRDLRYAIEFRHRSWHTPDTTALLAYHNIAWVAMDQTTRDQVEHAPSEPAADRLDDPAAHHPLIATTDFLYLRMLGKIGQFPDRTREHVDSTPRLTWWADRLRAAAERNPHLTTVYVMFDNNLTGFAPATAARFSRQLGLQTQQSSQLPDAADAKPQTQGQLFA